LFGSWCICCEQRINVGDKVHYQDDELVHAGCEIIPDVLLPQLARTEKLCGTCYTYHAGECP
jgi:hypothetical protein